MSNNSLGRYFVVTSFGESHGEGVGVVIDGCPSGIELDFEQIQQNLNLRRPGQSNLTTSRNEDDVFEIVSGLSGKQTTGAPICIFIKNRDQVKSDYDHLEHVFRPSHADYTYQAKYGIRNHQGGGRSSARVTAGWVAAGAIAQQVIAHKSEIEMLAFVRQIQEVRMPDDFTGFGRPEMLASLVRCPHPETSGRMTSLIEKIRAEGDSVGGIISCIIKNCPVGLGDPVFQKLQAQLAHAMLSINAVKGFEYGSGFKSARKKGSEHNDAWKMEAGKPRTETNFSGGIQGGISNGMDIYFNVAFKPTSSISTTQKTISSDFQETEVQVSGRHDPCVLPRAVPIVEALAALVLVDNML